MKKTFAERYEQVANNPNNRSGGAYNPFDVRSVIAFLCSVPVMYLGVVLLEGRVSGMLETVIILVPTVGVMVVVWRFLARYYRADGKRITKP